MVSHCLNRNLLYLLIKNAVTFLQCKELRLLPTPTDSNNQNLRNVWNFLLEKYFYIRMQATEIHNMLDDLQ